MTDPASTDRRPATTHGIDVANHPGHPPDCGEMYLRHFASARAYARQFTYNNADAEDITAEAFARILALIQRGLGPGTDGFKTYLRHTVRSCAVSHIKKREREYLADGAVLTGLTGPDGLDGLDGLGDRQAAADRQSLLVQAFGELSARHRLVLLLTAVDGVQPSVVAMALNKTPNQLAALAYRARNNLRDALHRLAAQHQAHSGSTAGPR
ncbi:RNA polymerase sigma factor [Amycolatopsis solani]|uniref:RNA polymerase sigma factor n=1 Tax=Amycolatopsis solani TaxID=3028615 RepID=UPI0025B1AD14|nr:sigma-70 family RNA polymerase sigma factor [Amycolatopsis sp. MEP2-6]